MPQMEFVPVLATAICCCTERDGRPCLPLHTHDANAGAARFDRFVGGHGFPPGGPGSDLSSAVDECVLEILASIRSTSPVSPR